MKKGKREIFFFFSPFFSVHRERGEVMPQNKNVEEGDLLLLSISFHGTGTVGPKAFFDRGRE